MTIDSAIAAATKAFGEAGHILGEAMLTKLGQSAQLTQQVAEALDHGHRLVLALEMHPTAPTVWWATIDDYQQLTRILTVHSDGQTRQ